MVTVVKDIHAAFLPEIEGDRMFVQTNWKAPKWRIMEVDLKNPSPERWREVVPQGEAVIDSFSMVGGLLAVKMTQNVVDRVKLFDANGKLVREIAPPTLGSIGGPYGRWDSSEA